MSGQINLGELQPFKYFMSVAVVIGLMFTFIAPDDDLQNGWWSHVLQWQLQTVTPMLFAIAVHAFLSRVGLLSSLNPWLKLAISGLVACALFAPVALLTDVLLASESIDQSVHYALLDELLAVTPPVFIFWMAINAPFQVGWRLNKSTTATSVNTPSERSGYSPGQCSSLREMGCNNVPFMKLVTDNIHGEIVFLKSELHYLLVVTQNGKELILYSLKRAIDELSEIDGFQPHRSYWVNSAFITSVEKCGREGIIKLIDGTELPISRSKMQQALQYDD